MGGGGARRPIIHVRLYIYDLVLYICDIWCIYRFGGLIDGCSALGVVYEVSLEVVMMTRA